MAHWVQEGLRIAAFSYKHALVASAWAIDWHQSLVLEKPRERRVLNYLPRGPHHFSCTVPNDTVKSSSEPQFLTWFPSRKRRRCRKSVPIGGWCRLRPENLTGRGSLVPFPLIHAQQEAVPRDLPFAQLLQSWEWGLSHLAALCS